MKYLNAIIPLRSIFDKKINSSVETYHDTSPRMINGKISRDTSPRMINGKET